jgi:hypothetical protein
MSLSHLEELKRELIGGDNETKISMLSDVRMDHIASIIVELNEKGIPGDLIETGSWRGGACIFMRAVLDEIGDKSRKVYVADSFDGVPKPDLVNFPIDDYSTHYASQWLKAPIDGVKKNFEKYGYLDDRSVFIPGWFKDTMPELKPASGKWGMLRLDGDIYESTIQVLNALYDDLSAGGYVIIDDFGSDVGAAHATRDFLHRIGRLNPPAEVTGALCPCGTFGCFTGSPFHPGHISQSILARKCLSGYWVK